MSVQARIATPARQWGYLLARRWLQILVGLASSCLAAIFSIVLGLNPPPQTIPLASFIHAHVVLALILGIGFVAITIASLLIAGLPTKQASVSSRTVQNLNPDAITDADLGSGWRLPRVVTSAIVSTVSGALFLSLLGVVLLRPSWCPTALCPAPQHVALTSPNGVHDANLDMYLTAIQSANRVLPGDPAQFSASALPPVIGAQRLDTATPSPYRVVIGLHSLVGANGYNIIIEQAQITILSIRSTPDPLNVWRKGAAGDFTTHIFRVDVSAATQGASIVATPYPDASAHVQLAPNEADALDLQLDATTPADIQFTVQVTYRLANETATHTLQLPGTYEVVYSTSANWHSYMLQGATFVPDHA